MSFEAISAQLSVLPPTRHRTWCGALGVLKMGYVFIREHVAKSEQLLCKGFSLRCVESAFAASVTCCALSALTCTTWKRDSWHRHHQRIEFVCNS